MAEANVVDMSHVNEKHSVESGNALLVEAFTKVVEYLARNNDLSEAEKHNFADTAVRAAKAFADLTSSKSEIVAEIKEILATGFPMEKGPNYRPGMVCQGPVKVFSMCPHHLLPVEYEVFIAYLPTPNGMVLGLSKLARIAITLGKRPVLQEQLASDIADVFSITDAQNDSIPGIETSGSAVHLVGRHSCMTCRGVASDALTAVTELRGSFFQSEMELKFLNEIRDIRSSKLLG